MGRRSGPSPPWGRCSGPSPLWESFVEFGIWGVHCRPIVCGTNDARSVLGVLDVPTPPVVSASSHHGSKDDIHTRESDRGSKSSSTNKEIYYVCGYSPYLLTSTAAQIQSSKKTPFKSSVGVGAVRAEAQAVDRTMLSKIRSRSLMPELMNPSRTRTSESGAKSSSTNNENYIACFWYSPYSLTTTTDPRSVKSSPVNKVFPCCSISPPETDPAYKRRSALTSAFGWQRGPPRSHSTV